MSRRTNEHLPRPGGLLQPGGRVHRVAHHHQLARAGARPGLQVSGHHDQAGIHPDVQRQRPSNPLLHPGVDLGHPLQHRQRRAHGPRRVVLVRHGRAEYREQGIPDLLLQPALPGMDLRDQSSQAVPQQIGQLLGIQTFPETGETGQIGEHHGYDPPVGPRRRAMPGRRVEAGSTSTYVFRLTHRSASVDDLLLIIRAGCLGSELT